MPDAPDNHFTRHGIDEDEFAAALEEAMRAGGADDDEIHQARIGTAVDAAMPDDDEWTLHRQR